MRLYDWEEMKDIDRLAVSEYGIPALLLMEQAGAAVFDFIRQHFPAYRAMGITVFCGPGNNGGDAAVIARRLFLDGARVRVVGPPMDSVRGESLAVNLNILRSLGVEYHIWEESGPDLQQDIPGSGWEMALDGLFGISFHGVLQAPWKKAAEIINTYPIILSLDVPSGIQSDGTIKGLVVSADHTLCLGGYKSCLVDFPARACCGEIHVLDIGFPPVLLSAYGQNQSLLTSAEVPELIQSRPRYSHKGDYGHLLLLGGQPGMAGAQVQAGLAALRAGAGLVTLALPQDCSTQAGLWPELMACLYRTPSEISSFLQKRTVRTVLMGPGWGQGQLQQDIMDIIPEYSGLRYLVADADALNILAVQQDLQKKYHQWQGKLVLTPHLGEFARLLKRSVSEIQSSKLSLARDFARNWNAWLVLKDAVTLVVNPLGQAVWLDAGDSTLAKGGSGDILSGLIAGLLTSGYEPDAACCLGVSLLGRAALLYSGQYGSQSALGRDILELLPSAWQFYQVSASCKSEK